MTNGGAAFTARGGVGAEGRAFTAACGAGATDGRVAVAGDGGLAIEAVARRQKVSSSYVRKLLAGDGTSFSEFLLKQRLALAHRRLGDPSFARRSISAIAYGAGFGDLSYFNRTFRRRYGATPTEVRAGALAARGAGIPG